MAIAAVPGVQARIELLFWHLAERWGRVAPQGVMLSLNPEQGTIDEMIGASRSRANAALRQLEDAKRLERRWRDRVER